MKRILYLIIIAALVGACNSPQYSSVADKDAPGNTDSAAVNSGSANTIAKAPEISLPNPHGDTVALSSLGGNIVLVDFWASWCKPCRAENPNVRRLYENYKDKLFTNGGRFQIYSVSLDNNKAEWTQAIAKDRLNWAYHVSDLRGWQSAAAKTYQVEAIPTNVLLDTTGVVLARDLGMDEVELYLKERLK